MALLLCFLHRLRSESKEHPQETYRNDNVIRQMYHAIHFHRLTTESKREVIFCHLCPKFHVCSMTSTLTPSWLYNWEDGYLI
jgi:hypothetical protein